VVESVEGEKVEKESEEAIDKKGALERPRKFQRYCSRKINFKDISLTVLFL